MLYAGQLGDGLIARPLTAEADGRGGTRGHVGGRLTGVDVEVGPSEDGVVHVRIRHTAGGPASTSDFAVRDGGAALQGRLGGAEAVVRRTATGVTASLAQGYALALEWDQARRTLSGAAGENLTEPGTPGDGGGSVRAVAPRLHRSRTPVSITLGAGAEPLTAALLALIGLRG